MGKDRLSHEFDVCLCNVILLGEDEEVRPKNFLCPVFPVSTYIMSRLQSPPQHPTISRIRNKDDAGTNEEGTRFLLQRPVAGKMIQFQCLKNATSQVLLGRSFRFRSKIMVWNDILLGFLISFGESHTSGCGESGLGSVLSPAKTGILPFFFFVIIICFCCKSVYFSAPLSLGRCN